jgi:hypothetical protein
VLTRDDGRCRGDRAPAVRAEVRAADDGRAACASGRGCGTAGSRGHREERVELLQPLVEREELVAPVDEEVLPELVAPVHLDHQPAQVAQPLLPRSQEGAPLAAEDARVRQRPPCRTGRRSRSALAGASEAGEPRHARNVATGPGGSGPAGGRAASPTEEEEHEEDQRDDGDGIPKSQPPKSMRTIAPTARTRMKPIMRVPFQRRRPGKLRELDDDEPVLGELADRIVRAFARVARVLHAAVGHLIRAERGRFVHGHAAELEPLRGA